MPRDTAILEAYVPTLLCCASRAGSSPGSSTACWRWPDCIAWSGIRRCFARACSSACAACWVSRCIDDSRPLRRQQHIQESCIMLIRKLVGFVMTIAIFAAALVIGRMLWVHYMNDPWTRDGRVRADVVNVAPDVSGAVVQMPLHDNQFVKKGDLLLEIDPSHYQIAVEQAQANVAARAAELRMRRADAARRADMDALVVSKEARENSMQTASTAEAQLQQANAALDAAKLNLERTKVFSRWTAT